MAAEPAAPLGRCSGQRDRFVIGPGPDAGGSNHGNAGWFHTPVKFGIDAAPCVAVTPGSAAPAAADDCVQAGHATAVANVTNRRTIRRTFMLISREVRPSSSAGVFGYLSPKSARGARPAISR